MDLGVLGIVISIVAILIGLFCWFFNPTTIKDKFKGHSVSLYVSNLKLRERYKVAIVDDEISNYPIDYIKNLGFDVFEHEEISFASAKELTKYDLLLLDVKGVVKEDLDEGGAKLIKIVKETRPLMPVIAVSSGFFHAELNDYFRSSDAIINKPIDEFKIRQQLLELKQYFFDTPLIVSCLESNIRHLEISKSKKNTMHKYIISFLSEEQDDGSEMLGFIHQYAKSNSEDIINKINILQDRIKND
ncbi:hypothetical protein [Vibrio splendidus]|uniref:hypothetical protein n=1 Tax=Vibrio splendidus TaxID=29497 RepID=UPI0034A0B41E